MLIYKLNNYQLGKLKQFGIDYNIIESSKNHHIIELDVSDSNVRTFVRINNIKEFNLLDESARENMRQLY